MIAAGACSHRRDGGERAAGDEEAAGCGGKEKERDGDEEGAAHASEHVLDVAERGDADERHGVPRQLHGAGDDAIAMSLLRDGSRRGVAFSHAGHRRGPRRLQRSNAGRFGVGIVIGGAGRQQRSRPVEDHQLQLTEAHLVRRGPRGDLVARRLSPLVGQLTREGTQGVSHETIGAVDQRAVERHVRHHGERHQRDPEHPGEPEGDPRAQRRRPPPHGHPRRVSAPPSVPSRRRCVGTCRGRDVEHEATPTQRNDQRNFLPLIELAAQPAGVHVDDVGVRVATVFPHVLHEFCPTHHPAGMPGEVVQEGELLGGEHDLARTSAHHAARGIDDQVAEDQFGGEHLTAATRQRAQSREKLAEIERLREIVVGPRVEAGDALLHRVERGEHEDRYRVLRGAERPADFQPVGPRHEDVEDHDVVVVLQPESLRLGPVLGEIDDVGRLAQATRDGLAELTVILGEQDAHGSGGWSG